MNSKKLIAAIEAYAKAKHIDKPTVARIINEVFSALILKEFGTIENFSIVVNPQKGDLQIFRTRQIVADDAEDRDDPDKIRLSEAQQIDADFEVGEELDQEIPLDQFKLRAQRRAREVFNQKTREIEDRHLYEKYARRIGEIITVEVRHKARGYFIMHDEEHNELILPKANQIPKDRLHIRQQVRVLIEKVEKREKGMGVVVSRSSPLFLEKLLQREIPEIQQGIVLVHKIVRRPGERAKIAVSSQDDRVDPVGAIVGVKGSRINAIREQICYESLDIVRYSVDAEQYPEVWDLYVRRALAPAKVKHIRQQQDQVDVYLEPDQMPLAIGARGQNIDLASQLIGMHINIRSEEESGDFQDDVALEEFADEISAEVLNGLKKLGLTTGRAVLALTPDELQEQSALPAEELLAAYKIIEQEFQK